VGYVLLLVSKLLGEDNLLLALNILHLPLAMLNNLVNNLLLLREFRDIGCLLVLQFIFKLSKKVDVACSKKKKKGQQKTTYTIRNPVDRNSADHFNFDGFISPSDAGALRMLEVEKAA